MKLITSSTKQADMFCGSIKKKPDMNYKRSQFCIETECDDGSILYNTLTGAMILLEKDEDTSLLEDVLIRYRFLVTEDIDEYRYADEYKSFLKLIDHETENKTSFTILTTTDCNARCYYCYEMGRKRSNMTKETAREVAAYIAEASGRTEVKIHWFGGEPLFNQEAIDTIISCLNEQGIAFTSRIITNAYYLDKTLAQKAKTEWNTKWVQITLDGTEHIYNHTKSYVDKDTDNPYIRVMNNIGNALDQGIKVFIRLNMDGRNADDLCILCDDLFERFAERGELKAYISFLIDFTGDIHQFASDKEAVACYFKLYDKLEKYGLCSTGDLERRIKSHKCMADSDSSEVILPDGNVGKCEHFSESEIVGSIYDKNRDETLIRAWKEIAAPFDECRDCTIYPRCFHLKKCEWDKKGCSASLKTIKAELLKKQILSEYKKWKLDNAE